MSEASGDGFNMSLRKYLKRVGVTSQQAIEEAVRASGKTSGAVAVKVVLTAPEIGLEHVIDGEIALAEDA
ncbi:DUF6494 family protein [Rubrimonas sp.]|uniref:DUF6494 family protein n=1 Tax=Rubrimonas sp. TaxID=2036015 RepID=UPI002FDCC49D